MHTNLLSLLDEILKFFERQFYMQKITPVAKKEAKKNL